jgi:hypothetical protein
MLLAGTNSGTSVGYACVIFKAANVLNCAIIYKVCVEIAGYLYFIDDLVGNS